MGLNFGAWLGRLGYKTGEQPILNLGAAQPVIIVGDHTHLVNNPVLCSYIIGGESVLDALNFGCLFVTTPVPLRLRELHIGVSQANRVHFTLGSVASLPAVLNQVVHTPQMMRLGPNVPPVRARWVTGSIVAAPLVTVPVVQAPNTATIAIQTSGVIVPSGGWFMVQTSVINDSMRFLITVDELPDDLPQ